MHWKELSWLAIYLDLAAQKSAGLTARLGLNISRVSISKQRQKQKDVLNCFLWMATTLTIPLVSSSSHVRIGFMFYVILPMQPMCTKVLMWSSLAHWSYFGPRRKTSGCRERGQKLTRQIFYKSTVLPMSMCWHPKTSRWLFLELVHGHLIAWLSLRKCWLQALRALARLTFQSSQRHLSKRWLPWSMVHTSVPTLWWCQKLIAQTTKPYLLPRVTKMCLKHPFAWLSSLFAHRPCPISSHCPQSSQRWSPHHSPLAQSHHLSPVVWIFSPLFLKRFSSHHYKRS